MQVIGQARRFGQAALAVAAGCAAVLAVSTAAQAASPPPAVRAGTARQGAGPAAPFGGTSHLSSVSCPPGSAGTWCLAVGGYRTTDGARHSLAAIRTGSGWRTLRNPPGSGLIAVSCSSPTFCMAAGGPTGDLTWNGSSWRTVAAPSGGLAGVTCGSRTLCVGVSGQAFSMWRGTAWHEVKKVTDFCNGTAPGPCGIASVSCGSTTNCMAVGTWTVSQERCSRRWVSSGTARSGR